MTIFGSGHKVSDDFKHEFGEWANTANSSKYLAKFAKFAPFAFKKGAPPQGFERRQTFITSNRPLPDISHGIHFHPWKLRIAFLDFTRDMP